MPDIALATCAAWPHLHPSDAPLRAELEARGHAVHPCVWSDAAVDWRRYHRVLIRSTWDYYQHPAAFRAWLDHLAATTVPLVNPPALVRWNLDKRYLRQLADAGIATLPTQWLPQGSDAAALPDLLAAAGWDEVVLKPAVSAGAWQTYRFAAAAAAAHVAPLAAILAECDALLQPFAPEVLAPGEFSLFFFGGAFSHAVLKTPRTGDYRVQPQYDSRIRAVAPDAALLAQAAAVLAAVPHPWRYARVDGIVREGRLLLMELEVIEPHLFLDFAPGAAARYVDAVLR